MTSHYPAEQFIGSVNVAALSGINTKVGARQNSNTENISKGKHSILKGTVQ